MKSVRVEVATFNLTDLETQRVGPEASTYVRTYNGVRKSYAAKHFLRWVQRCTDEPISSIMKYRVTTTDPKNPFIRQGTPWLWAEL